ncbi:MAG: L-fucose/L-arabinose isomerase family protein [Anaerolineales bacterium]
MTPLTVGFVPIARSTFDIPLAEDMTRRVWEALQGANVTLVGSQALVLNAEDVETTLNQFEGQAFDALLVLQASFADSTMLMQVAAQIDAPLILWALPEAHTGGRLRLNSFCGINLGGHALRRAGKAYDYIYAEPEDAAALEKVRQVATAAAVRRKLQGARIGRVGEHPDGFETCAFDADALRDTFGVDVVQLTLEAVFEAARQADPVAVEAVQQSLSARVVGLGDLDADAVRGTLSTYVTLRDTRQAQSLDGFAVRCWPQFFTDLGCAACGSSSMLNDEMIPSSCEADVNGTLTQLMLQWVSDAPVFGSDIVSFDDEAETVILWHCGKAPLSMADPSQPPSTTVHSNRGMPLLMQFTLKPGRVTLARLSEAEGTYRLVIGGGEMIAAPPAFSGTVGTLRPDGGAMNLLDTLLGEGLEHHVAVAYGDHIATLETLARMLNVPVLRL